MADIMAIQEDFALLQIIEAAEHIYNGALSCTGGTHQRSALPGLHMEVDMLQNIDALFISEGHILIIHPAGDLGQILGIGFVFNIHLLIHGIKDALQIGACVDEAVIDIGNGLDGAPEAGAVGGHGDNNASGILLLGKEKHRHNIEEAGHHAGDIFDDGRHQKVEGGNPHSRLGHLFQKIFKDILVDLFPIEGLGDLHTVDGFADIGGHIGILGAPVGVGLSLPPLDQNQIEDHQRQPCQNAKGQLGGEGEHKEKDKDQREPLHHNVDQPVGQKVRHIIHIVNHPHQNLASGAAIKIIKGKLLDMGEDIGADLMNDPMAGLGGEPGLKIGAKLCKAGGGKIKKGNDDDRFYIFVWNKAVDDHLGIVGAQKPEEGGENAEDQAADERLDIAEDVGLAA